MELRTLPHFAHDARLASPKGVPQDVHTEPAVPAAAKPGAVGESRIAACQFVWSWMAFSASAAAEAEANMRIADFFRSTARTQTTPLSLKLDSNASCFFGGFSAPKVTFKHRDPSGSSAAGAWAWRADLAASRSDFAANAASCFATKAASGTAGTGAATGAATGGAATVTGGGTASSSKSSETRSRFCAAAAATAFAFAAASAALLAS
mmetsp:Transcript_9188/g.31623  ORF Transcript_9188/g.31623 Transcript_9188/m.31623 type:complete len:208 (+) Transcript_9188:68-691(+)